jgi:uncharacterized protein
MVSMLSILLFGWAVTAKPSTIPLTLPEGAVIQVELAQTREEHALGLMGRSSLPIDHGMLFIFEQEELHYFWMKNTLIALDIIWMDSEKRIVYIQENVTLCKKDPCPAYGPSVKSLYVLEIHTGSVQRHGIKTGMILQF